MPAPRWLRSTANELSHNGERARLGEAGWERPAPNASGVASALLRAGTTRHGRFRPALLRLLPVRLQYSLCSLILRPFSRMRFGAAPAVLGSGCGNSRLAYGFHVSPLVQGVRVPSRPPALQCRLREQALLMTKLMWRWRSTTKSLLRKGKRLVGNGP